MFLIGRNYWFWKHKRRRKERRGTCLGLNFPLRVLPVTNLFSYKLFTFPFDWRIDWLIAWLTDCLLDWLIDGLNDWLIDCLIAWLIDWLIQLWLCGRATTGDVPAVVGRTMLDTTAVRVMTRKEKPRTVDCFSLHYVGHGEFFVVQFYNCLRWLTICCVYLF